MLETWLQESRVRRRTIVMLQTWLRESRVRLPAIVMLETWLREGGVPRQTVFISSGNLNRIITLPFSPLTTLW